MIIVKIYGGLGNQMFQYALGFHMARIYCQELKLDLSFFEYDKRRPYQLEEVFGINVGIATPADISELVVYKQSVLEGFIRSILSRPQWRKAGTCFSEKQFNFDSDVFKRGPSLYLDGYWQSEKYFLGSSDEVRKQFCFKSHQDTKNQKMSQLIESKESISVHIRRGDYVRDLKTNEMLGLCDLEYYSSCIDHVVRVVNNPYFFFFSDDMDWVIKNFQIKYPAEFICHNAGEKSFEDMRLMSQCKHHIIANSTFSWWGAWLNPSKTKIIMAPKEWMRDKKINTSTVVPENWIAV